MFFPMFCHHDKEEGPMYNQSFITLSKRTVIDQCDLVINNIDEYNNKKKVAYIRQCMIKWNNGWWHKFRKKPDYTMETAENRIKDELEEDEYRGILNQRHGYCTDYHPNYGHRWRDIAMNVRRIAVDALDDVMVTAEDWSVLTGSWSKGNESV